MSTSQIIILVILTILILGLTTLAFSTFYERTKDLVEDGKKDKAILKEFTKQKKEKTKDTVVSSIGKTVSSIAVLILIAIGTLCFFSQRTNGELTLNNQVILVIASNSMDGFYDAEYEEELTAIKEDAKTTQFAKGDILTFKKVEEDEDLIPFDVYGYITKDGRIITHRYIKTIDDVKLMFRGDNTKGRDTYIKKEQVLYHYTGNKLTYIGNFILFFRSTLGIYSIIAVVIIYMIAEIYNGKYKKLYKKRYKELCKQYYTTTPVASEQDAMLEEYFVGEANQATKKKLPPHVRADFYRKDGTHVIIYEKGYNKENA